MPQQPRTLDATARARVGLGKAPAPYAWPLAAFVVALAVAPLAFAKLWWLCVAVAVGGLVVLPALRWQERHEHTLREKAFTHGDEVVGRVVAIEPGGPTQQDRVIRVEFDAGNKRYTASVRGSVLARQGLMPGEDVEVFYDPANPLRCVINERIKRRSARSNQAPSD